MIKNPVSGERSSGQTTTIKALSERPASRGASRPPSCTACRSAVCQAVAFDDVRLFCASDDSMAGYVTGPEALSCPYYAKGRPQKEELLVALAEVGEFSSAPATGLYGVLRVGN